MIKFYSNKILKLVEDKVEESLQDVGKLVVEDAQTIVPVDTGKLRDSIDFNKIDKTTINIVADTDYAADVELGTLKTRAQPYLRPAVYKNRDRILKQFKNRI